MLTATEDAARSEMHSGEHVLNRAWCMMAVQARFDSDAQHTCASSAMHGCGRQWSVTAAKSHPVSSEISDPILYVSYFASQSKGINFGD